jgi:hypothetical protein
MKGTDAGTRIVYELTAKPAFDLPEALVRRLLRRDSGRMIESLRKEMAARGPRQLTGIHRDVEGVVRRRTGRGQNASVSADRSRD